MVEVTNFQVNAKLFMLFLLVLTVMITVYTIKSIDTADYNGCIASHYDEWSNDKICDKFQPLHFFTVIGIISVLLVLVVILLGQAYFIVYGVPDIG